MSGKKIFKNALYLFLSNVIVRIIAAFTTILIARTLGVEDYGILSVTLAIAAVTGYFTDLGLTHTLMREATKSNANLSVLMSIFFKLRIFFAFITCLISLIIFEAIYTDVYFKNILYWVVFPTIWGAALQGVGAAYFQVIEKMHTTALIRTIAGLTTSFALILGMIFNWPLAIIGPTYGAANILAGIFSILFVTKNINIFKGWDKAILSGLLSFTFSGFVIMLLPQLGPIILERVSTLKEVGYFSVAYRIPTVLYQLPGIIAVAFYPILFRYGNSGHLDEHLKLNTIQLKIMSFLGIAMSIPFLLFSEWWTLFLFGNEWLEASKTLSILAIIVILQGISYPIADALTTTGLQARRMKVLLIGLFVGVPLYCLLGLNFGSIGGATAAVIIEAIILIGFVIRYPKGLILISRGLRYNLSAFTITLLFFFSFYKYINPLFANFLAVMTFSLLVIFLDREFRHKIAFWVKNDFYKIDNN